MLIGIDASRAVAGERTGTENYSLYLIRAMLADPRQHRYRLYASRAPSEGLLPRDDRVGWRVMPFPRLWTHLRLAWELQRHPPDVLFVPAHVIPLLHPRNCVATVHDLGYLHYPQAHTPTARRYLDWSTRFNLRASRHVIVDSMATAEDLVRCYGAARERITVAYPAGTPGLRPVTDPQALATVRARYGTGSRYLLFLGTLQPRKNIATLIEAFRLARERGGLGAETRLVLAGRPGWLYGEIEAAIARSGLEEAIVRPGYVAQEDLATLLSGALAFVLPSWYEGFGLPILEAMACDTPVICSNVSSLPEVAGDAALLFAPDDVEALADAMARLYADEGLREALVQRGRVQWARFGWGRCAATVLDVLEAVGEGGAHGR
jgi:glycosyltransferase involved in cell wall biosynthesis